VLKRQLRKEEGKHLVCKNARLREKLGEKKESYLLPGKKGGAVQFKKRPKKEEEHATPVGALLGNLHFRGGNGHGRKNAARRGKGL